MHRAPREFPSVNTIACLTCFTMFSFLEGIKIMTIGTLKAQLKYITLMQVTVGEKEYLARPWVIYIVKLARNYFSDVVCPGCPKDTNLSFAKKFLA